MITESLSDPIFTFLMYAAVTFWQPPLFFLFFLISYLFYSNGILSACGDSAFSHFRY